MSGTGGTSGIGPLGLALVVVWIAGGCGGGGSKSASPTATPAATLAAARPATVTASASTASVSATAPPATATDAPGAAIPAASAEPTAQGRIDEATAICPEAAERLPAASVSSDELIEISGLAASRTNAGVLWAHNDSGDAARVFAMDVTGAHLATYTLAGADAVDWEDMAVGPSASRDASELYLGDIGDNARARTEVIVYRVREPAVDRSAAPVVRTLAGIERLTLRYPDGAHDAETLIVDPVSGDLIIVTKDAGGSQIFRATGRLDANSTATLELVGRIDVSQLKRRTEFPADAPPLARAGGALATGGDISPSGDLIVIRTYSAVWMWSRAPGQSIGEALTAPPCEASSAAEQQGEAIAFDADGRGYVTVSEGEHPALHHFAR